MSSLIVQPGRTTIRRLRCPGLTVDVARPLDRAVSRLDLRPAALPPAAILCVRRLVAPPARLAARGGEVQLQHNWDQRVRDELDGLTRAAARPARGPVPAHAQAVIFADGAELLACLSADWLSGVVQERWWWDGLLRGSDPTASFTRAWLNAPTCAAAAFDVLDRQGRAVTLLRAVPDMTLPLLERVVRVHALQYLEFLLEPNVPTVASAPTGVAAPWRTWAPDVGAAVLAWPEQVLLGVSTGLRRAPQEVGTRTFARQVSAWMRGTGARQTTWTNSGAAGDVPTRVLLTTPVASGIQIPTEAPDVLRDAEPTVVDPPNRPSPTRQRLAAASASSRFPVEESDTTLSDIPSRATATLPASGLEPHDVLLPEGAPVGAFGEQADHSIESYEPTQSSAPLPPVAAAISIAPAAEPGATRPPSLESAPASEPAAQLADLEELVDSSQAGALFLINVAVWTGAYADFSHPAATDVDLPIWDWVALIGDALLQGALQADPLWALLARLAQRHPGQAPGAAFDPPRVWRLPQDWLAANLEWERNWRSIGSRIARTIRWRRWAPARRALWVHWLTAQIRVRLVRALAPRPPETVESLLTGLHARIHVTQTRMDVVYRLNELPVEIRRAGLDRDPGWVPAAGRTIAFHFEP